jgi:citrate lyase subunit beta/citryl-CoA lyase
MPPGTEGLAALGPRPLRSLLFVPGHRERWVDPAVASGADGILFDLQDAVPRPQLGDARAVVAGAIDRLGPSGPAVLVRTGSPGSDDLLGDLDAVVRPGLAAVVVPMVTGPEDVAYVAGDLDRLEKLRGMAAGSVAIMPLVETARAARFCFEIAVASERVAYMGGATAPEGDIARDLGFTWTPAGEETLFLRSWVLLNVRAAGVAYPISGMWPLLNDLGGLARFARHTQQLGYTGMMAIHPSHIPVINEVFTPSSEEIARWVAICQALEDAQAQGLGALRFESGMIDAAHAQTAQAGLAFARRLGLI